jgi:hypothetical protein
MAEREVKRGELKNNVRLLPQLNVSPLSEPAPPTAAAAAAAMSAPSPQAIASPSPVSTGIVGAILGRVKEVSAQVFKQQKPWTEVLDRNAVSKPANLAEASRPRDSALSSSGIGAAPSADRRASRGCTMSGPRSPPSEVPPDCELRARSHNDLGMLKAGQGMLKA